jgi:hypothetical protein
MKSEMRHKLARESFEEKVRKVGELIRLSKQLKAQRTRESAEDVAEVEKSADVYPKT